MDVEAWLRGLGLQQYQAAFRDNEIDGAVLRDLTADDLRELGVASVGHRRKLLSAISELSAASDSAMATSSAQLPAPDAAERRQLTVMFCDLVGSTAMSARLDPEDMRAIIGAYHKCCASLIAANGGFVAKYMGDGVLAYFGYPQAHEHDAERAVRAGLAIVEAAPNLQTVAGALHVRVGIATGIVVVGDLLGSGEAQERGVVGDTPNLAARLLGIAAPDSVVIAEGTRKLLGDLFELADLGPHDLKGIAGPTRVFAALRESSQESRFEALHAGELTELIGREEETDLLFRRWDKAKAGEGQVVLLSGEAGIGKSRLTAAMLARLVGEPHLRMRYFCSPQHTDSALHPIIGNMERAAGFERADDAKTKLDKLDALLAGTATSRDDAALLAEMLSLANDGRYPARELAPQQRRQKAMEALIAQIETISQQTPVMMIFEDAHWTDPSSLEMLGRLVDRIAPLHVLLFVTFRPEFSVPWAEHPHVTALTINRLGAREAAALIDQVAGNQPLPENIRQDIVERADGIPLFIEEMTKAVLEAESEGAAARTVSAIPSSTLAVPASLHASLMARLDRLGPAKGVARCGAAIGREFSHALLAQVADLSGPELNSALDRLLQSGLLSRQGAPPNATYIFKHALVQDAAYGTLLREPRRALHARIAAALDSQFADSAASRPELLARHYAEAGLIEKAASRWGKAGQMSLARSALVEAAEQLARALDLIGSLPATPALRREQIAFQVALGTALMSTKGMAAAEARLAFEQARLFMERADALGEPPDNPLMIFSVLYGFWLASFAGFDGDEMHELASQLLALAQKQSRIVPLMMAHRAMGSSSLLTGEFEVGRACLDQAIALFDAAECGSVDGRDAFASSLTDRSLALWILGHPEAALADAERVVTDVRDLGRAVPLIYVLGIGSLAIIHCGDYATGYARFGEAIVLANEKGAAFWKAGLILFQGCVLAITGKSCDAVEMIEGGLVAFRTMGSKAFIPFFLSHLARAHSELGQMEEAWRSIHEAIRTVDATKERWFEAEVLRIAGELTLKSPETDAAKAVSYFERALAVARAQRTRSWELRAAMSLARLRRGQGRRADARDLLAPVYGWFTEGFDTLDLKEAKALLDELSS